MGEPIMENPCSYESIEKVREREREREREVHEREREREREVHERERETERQTDREITNFSIMIFIYHWFECILF